MSIETGESPHTATARHEQGLSWILWLLDTAERTELLFGLDSSLERMSK